MRTNATDVRAIMDDTTLTDTIIDKYINSANLFVTNALGTTLDEDTLESIEQWVSAHLIQFTRERQSKKEGAGGAFIEYTGVFGEGLKGTSYGQMAIALDTTGVLDNLAKGRKSFSLIAL
jgi:hypothetical protein